MHKLLTKFKHSICVLIRGILGQLLKGMSVCIVCTQIKIHLYMYVMYNITIEQLLCVQLI